MKPVLRPRSATVPETNSTEDIQRWCTRENTANKNLKDDIEDALTTIGVVKFWTPVLTFATPGNLAVSYSTQWADVIRTRSHVIASFEIITNTFTWTTASGFAMITGLPYTGSTIGADNSAIWNGTIALQGVTKAGYTNFNSQMRSGQNFLYIAASGSGQPITLLQAADMPSGGAIALVGTVSFRVRP